MSMLDELLNAGGAQAISRDLGVDQQTAQSGMAALLPAILGGMQNQAEQSPQGIGGLASILGGLGGGGLFDNAVSNDPTDVNQGNQVLGQIFGNKDTSRTVADHAAQQTGISPDLLKKMLPIVAMLAAGYFANRARGQGGGLGGAGAGMGGGALGGILGSLLGGGMGGTNPLNQILAGALGGRR